MPDRTPTAKVPLVVSLLASVATALVAARVGAQTTFSAPTFAGKLTGALIIAATLVLLAGMFTIVRLLARKGSPVGITITLLTTATALGFNLMMAITQLTVGDLNYWLAYWITLATLLSWALYDLVRALGPFGTYPRKLALGFGISSVLAIANFAYSQIYLPYAQQPSIAMQPLFGTAEKTSDKTELMVPFSVTLTTKAVPIHILGATYSVVGRKATTSKQARSGDELRRDLQNGNDPAARLAVDGEEFVQGGVLFEPGSEYIPDEVHTVSKVVRLPADTAYDSLRLTTDVTFLRADRASIDMDEVKNSRRVDHRQGQEFVAYQGRLSEGNALNRTTRNPVWFYHEWAVGQQPDGRRSEPSTFLTQDGTAVQDNDKKVTRRYGLWSQTEVITLPLPR